MVCSHPKRDTEWDLSKIRGDVLTGRCLRCKERLTVNISDYSPSQSQVNNICERTRNKFEKSSGNCLKISTYILSALHDMGVPATVNKTEINGFMHYEVHAIIDGDKVLIDASRNQFVSYK